MNIYLVYRTDRSRVDYDEFDSFVVVAESEEQARHTHPNGEKIVDGKSLNNWAWVDPRDVSVELLGKASEGVKPGIVCASFNAG